MYRFTKEEKAIVANWGLSGLRNKQQALRVLALANDIRRIEGNKVPFEDCVWEAEQRLGKVVID